MPALLQTVKPTSWEPSQLVSQLYVKYLLKGYHKKVDTSCKALEPDHFKVGAPVLFNQKRTNVIYLYRLFNFGVIHEVRLHRNSSYPRTILVRCFERGKIIIKATRPEDMMLLKTEGDIGFITDSDISVSYTHLPLPTNREV